MWPVQYANSLSMDKGDWRVCLHAVQLYNFIVDYKNQIASLIDFEYNFKKLRWPEWRNYFFIIQKFV